MDYSLEKDLIVWLQPEGCGQRLYIQVKSVTSSVPQGSALGPVHFNILISDTDDGIECTLSMFPDDLTGFNKAQCMFWHLGQGNSRYIYKWGELENRSPEKDLGVLADEKLNESAACICRSLQPKSSYDSMTLFIKKEIYSLAERKRKLMS